ncbi:MULTISPECIES: HutD family protein [unclassified Streptomyces]|uniref:HutD/Ves family protein n=1 Tax=unclassified Streptomyces TaxID=2593676 RepID=UPI002E120F58|nr:HutD family protein [Streptomyces sp. NBC_01197]WSS48528.1 HutD family protein [Streptomyces sp. NBC_01180]
MTVRILRAAGRAAAPWKNGGGVTREIAAGPEGAGMDTFAWRVSLADVGADGPFSVFPGVTRVLTVVDGAGMELTAGGVPLRADARFVPHRFAGDVATHGRLLEGPVVNFNVMYRETLTEALTSVVRGRLTLDVPPDATVLVVALDGTAALEDAGAALAPYDAAVVTGESPGVLRADGHTALVTLRSGTRSA